MGLVLLNLGRTLLLELPILVAFFRKQPLRCIVFGVFLNAFTLPLVSYAVYELDVNWYAGEIAVLLTEFLIIWLYWRVNWYYALAAAAATNVVSAYFFKVFPGLL